MVGGGEWCGWWWVVWVGEMVVVGVWGISG